MHSQTRTMLGLGLGLAAVTSLLAFWEAPKPIADPDATETVWVGADRDDLVSLTITHEGEAVELRLIDDLWHVTAPFEALADFDATHDALSALRGLDRGVPVEAVDGEPFGLGPTPLARVSATDSKGQTTTLEVGTKAPVGYRTYVRAASGTIVAANGNLVDALTVGPSRFRDHRVFRFDPAEVRRLTMRSSKGELVVHGSKTSWWLDGYSRADPNAVDDLVTGLLELRYDVVLDMEDKVEEPSMEAIVEMSDGAEHRLAVGRQTPYGRIGSVTDGRIGAIFPDMLRIFDAGPGNLTDKFLPLVLDRDERVVWTVGSKRFEAKRNGPAWVSEGFDEGAVWDAMRDLSELPLLLAGPLPQELGPSQESIEVHGPRGKVVVLLGTPDEQGTPVADERGGAVVRVPTEPIEGIRNALRLGK